MNNPTIQKQTDKSILFNRLMYGCFVLLSLYYLLLNKDPADAMSNLGIALIFDPFDQKVTWNDRPLYQRVWLYMHLLLLFALIIYLIFHYFSGR